MYQDTKVLNSAVSVFVGSLGNKLSTICSLQPDFNRRPKHLLQAVLCIIVGALQLPVQLLHLRPRLHCGRQSLEKVIFMEGQRTCCHHPILAILHFKIMIVYDKIPCERAPRSYRKRGWARSPQYEGSHRFSR